MEENNRIIRDPEKIKKEIAALELELKKSEEHNRWEYLTGSDEPGDAIGFFNLAKARLILTHLNQGERLQLRHDALGTYEVYMSPQGNRILLKKESEHVTENNIMGFIVWHAGDWYKTRKK